MIDPELIRNEKTVVDDSCQTRWYPLSFLTNYRELDQKWREKLQEVDALKYQRNQKTPKGKPSQEEQQALATLSGAIKKAQEDLQPLEKATREAALLIPNVLFSDVPIGKNAEENAVLGAWGDRPLLSNPKSHDALGEALGILDFGMASRISGARFAVYKGWGAKLERALINFMLDLHTTQHGYQEIMPPALVNAQSLVGTGQLPKFQEDLFKIEDQALWLSPTAEVQLTNLFSGQILDAAELPVALTAYTPCFRKEAGSYGKDVKGLIPLHQFNKIGLDRLIRPEDSQKELALLIGHAQKVLELLELPYRTVQLCSGDTGFSSAKTLDLEVWMPSQNQYREISSCSCFSDFQARRAMIRYKEAGKTDYLHTLNGSGLAVGRTFAAILENYQTQTGIRIPKVLEPYLGIGELLWI